MKRYLFSIIGLSALALAAFAQSTTNQPPMPAPVTNALSGFSTFENALNLLPYWDKTLTNTFGAKELEIEAAPLWKSMTASGSTPYLSIGGEYFPWRNFGIGGELITFGDGAGNNSVDTGLVNLKLRKDIGNIAGYILAGGGYDWNSKGAIGAFGVGVEYRYKSNVSLFLDTRWELEGTKNSENGWLTRVGAGIWF